MGLFDIFTGGSVKDAANQYIGQLGNLSAAQTAAINAARTQGINALQSGKEGALGALGPAIDTARSDISSAVGPALGALYGGQNLASSALTGAVDPAIAALYGGAGAAAGAWNPVQSAAGGFLQGGTQAGNAVANALGLNGPAGNASAMQQFQAGPGFQYALDQALQQATRGANAVGTGASGNTLQELLRQGTGMGQQAWQQYIQNLTNQQQLLNPLALQGLTSAAGGIANAGLQAGTGAANIYTGTGGRLADLYSGTGKAGAGIYGGAGQSLADLAKIGGLASADIFSNEAAREAGLLGSLANTQVGALGQLGPQYGSAYGAIGAADMAGSKNLWNLGLNLAGLGTGSGLLKFGGPSTAGPGSAYSTAFGLG